MEQNILEFIITEGVFGTLFCYLLFYTLQENNKREEHYQNLIKELVNRFTIIEKDLENMKN
ncbi:BhlA/UviB family holin-like peptide [Sarcina ventriculi]|uniref:BhlA/UviB family holin-like peptide n=1 Tax=Sarcina ventriculi TaxID=1267 RepID=UPI0018AA90C7|nr:BhlA/UviB family holin-like peptide [Sarcina ventriculi]